MDEIQIDKKMNGAFQDYIEDWEHEQYILMGGYGSSKSYCTAFKLIMKLLQEKRKCLVVRQVYDTIKESCFDLFKEILNDMGILSEDISKRRFQSDKVTYTDSPMGLKFPNGSRVIFKGLDKVAKIKSINGISIVWIEEASEITYAAYKELLGRIRTPNASLHFILTFNPVGMENWTVKHFFEFRDNNGKRRVKLDHKLLYEHGIVIQGDKYFMHSTADDNQFLPIRYLERLDEMKEYDPDLYRIAREGRLGPNGRRVLPQFKIAKTHKEVADVIKSIPRTQLYAGMDFGFEESYNALIKCAVVDAPDGYKDLYIYWEYYKNHMTDMQTAKELKAVWPMDKMIIADSAK